MEGYSGKERITQREREREHEEIPHGVFYREFFLVLTECLRFWCVLFSSDVGTFEPLSNKKLNKEGT